MKFALVSQYYWPHLGGAQKVVQELGESLVALGHEVEIITSFDQSRTSNEYQGVRIKTFNISGNLVNGLFGDISDYQKYITTNTFDYIFIYAAQQWGLDALIPVLDKIKAKKVHVPCGYSGFYNPSYKSYFEHMASVLKKFDLLIYHSENYFDYQYATSLGLNNLKVIPNGASEDEFSTHLTKNLRSRFNISVNDKLLITVGTPPYSKGHLDLLKVFKDDFFDHHYTLVLNGNYKLSGMKSFIKEMIKFIIGKSIFNISIYALWLKVFRNKKVLLTNLNRADLLSLMNEADLFLFMSHVEYSPLVLFETAAAGTPFVSVPCGNANEIAQWTQAGIVIEKTQFLASIQNLLSNNLLYEQLAMNGVKNFRQRYNWKTIMNEYHEALGII